MINFKNTYFYKMSTYSSFIITQKGKVYGCGENSDGSLGLDHTFNIFKFTKIPNLQSVKKLYLLILVLFVLIIIMCYMPQGVHLFKTITYMDCLQFLQRLF